ncbi:TPA: hypothetical protein ACWW6D_004096 [Klebsiella pneumoniae]
MNTQYFIDGDLVTCTVYNDAGLSFFSTVTAIDGDLPTAMSEALTQAKKSRDEYKTNED